MSQQPLSDLQQQAEMIRFTLDIYLETLIRYYPDLLRTTCFKTFLSSLTAFQEGVAEWVHDDEKSALTMNIEEMEKMLQAAKERSWEEE